MNDEAKIWIVCALLLLGLGYLAYQEQKDDRTRCLSSGGSWSCRHEGLTPVYCGENCFTYVPNEVCACRRLP